MALGFTELEQEKWNTIKVLIVDDQLSSAQLVKSVLDKIAIKSIDIATCYQHAIQLCQTQRYDLILFDFHLNQNINGGELLSLLRQQNLIRSNCGIIFFSGDHSPEVISTTMGIEPDCFLTKPINVGTLKQRVISVYKVCLHREPIYQALDKQDHQQAIQLCRHLLREQGHNLHIETLLLELLIEIKQWQQAEQLLLLFKQHSQHHKLSLIEAKLATKKGYHLEAINRLKRLIKHVPLCVFAYDELASLYQQNNQVDKAQEVAMQVLTLTPTIPHRALTVAQLSADMNDIDNFLQAGKTLATHLPIIDKLWLVHFAEYTAIFEQIYTNQLSNQHNHRLHTAIKDIHHLAQLRLQGEKKQHLDAFANIALARLYHIDKKIQKSKRRLLKGLSPFFGVMLQAPSIVMIEALPMLISYGESRLIGEIYQVLMTRSELDEHSQHRLNELKEKQLIIENVRLLVSHLETAKANLIQDPKRAGALYQTILHDYPQCSEAMLGYCESLLNQKAYNHSDIQKSLKQLKTIELPQPLADWRKSLIAKLSSPQVI
ncbi:response regulator [Photobacterium sp. GB-210]|uniref:response regulator n=1 Tax=Photobacterium sp. GB-210 TaxID=2022104 RepID=UPI000D16FC0E|nr:response regulator [Photobacterium sp. GB-210]PSV39761.1 response regulator [Photobacterium sp. GB-210]